MPTALRFEQQGRLHGDLMTCLDVYRATTPGVLVGDNVMAQATALWSGGLAAMLAVLQERLVSSEHAAFRARLRAPPGERPESQ
jgi:hypothetical protein